MPPKKYFSKEEARIARNFSKRKSRKKIISEETIEERDLRRSKDNAIHKKNYPKRKALMSKEEADRKKIRQAAACKRWRTKQKALASGSSNALAASSSVPVAPPHIPRTPQQLPNPLNAHSIMVAEINRARGVITPNENKKLWDDLIGREPDSFIATSPRITQIPAGQGFKLASTTPRSVTSSATRRL